MHLAVPFGTRDDMFQKKSGVEVGACELVPQQVLGFRKYTKEVKIFCFLLLGTDTAGSVRVPAAYCGILGFRPSHGAISVAGVVPMAQSLDTVGMFSLLPII